jgi:hypothetical protein
MYRELGEAFIPQFCSIYPNSSPFLIANPCQVKRNRQAIKLKAEKTSQGT